MEIAVETRERLTAFVWNRAVGKWLFADFNHTEAERTAPSHAKVPFGFFVQVRGDLPQIGAICTAQSRVCRISDALGAPQLIVQQFQRSGFRPRFALVPWRGKPFQHEVVRPEGDRIDLRGRVADNSEVP